MQKQREAMDCHKTVLSMLLCVPYDSVPDFQLLQDDRSKFNAVERDFLSKHGYSVVHLKFECELDEILEAMKQSHPKLYWILGCQVGNETDHSVLCVGGNIFCDPLTGCAEEKSKYKVTSDGFFSASFIVDNRFIQK